MDFVGVLSTLVSLENVFSLVTLGLFCWLLVKYIPERDAAFLEAMNSYKEALVSFQAQHAEFHREMVHLINEHDKHSLETNLKISTILRRIEQNGHHY